MNKLSFIALLAVMPFGAFAEGEGSAKLDLNVRRIGLEWSKTDVRHADRYQDSPVSALKADGQDFIKGIFDTALQYSKGRFQWDNTLFMEYGETILKPYNAPETINENADDIILSSDLSYACWEFAGFKLGPTVRGAYDTEFKSTGNAPRQNILRANGSVFSRSHLISAFFLQ